MLFLFDIDGTLIGGDGSGRRAFEQAVKDELGVDNGLGTLRLDGLTDAFILSEVFRVHRDRAPTVEESERILTRYLEHLAEGLRDNRAYHLKPGVEDALVYLESRGAFIGLGTGNIKGGARIKLERGKIWHRFAFGGFGCDAEARAELIRIGIARGEAIAGHAFPLQERFVIGDTPKDIAAAHAAGARAVGVATGSFTVEDLLAAGADEAHPTLTDWLATLR